MAFSQYYQNTMSDFSYAGKFQLDISSVYFESVKPVAVSTSASKIVSVEGAPISRDRYKSVLSVDNEGLVALTPVEFGRSKLEKKAMFTGFFTQVDDLDLLTLLRYDINENVPKEVLVLGQQRAGNDVCGFYSGQKLYIPSAFSPKPNPELVMSRTDLYRDYFERVSAEYGNDAENIVASLRKM